MRASRRPVPDHYIVVLADNADADEVALDAEVRFGGRRKNLFRRALKGFSLRLNRSGAERLSRDPRVRYVEQDGVVTLMQAPPLSWGLDRINQRSLPFDDDRTFGAIGAGITVHVIDTGIRSTHMEFGGRAFVAADYVDDDGDENPFDVGNDDYDPLQPDGIDCHGHGTHVAGTIGGASYGVAKGVTLLAHRVLSCGGFGTISSVVAAVDAITATTARPAVANMSIGATASDALDEAIRQSIQSGVTYVVAAGNNNDTAANYSPARVAEAITVGATDGADVRASFSNTGSALDLFAPGVGIPSAAHTSDSATTVMSGTSMAAPHAAGVAALHLEEQPTLTPQAVRDLIVRAATPNVVFNGGTGSPNRLLYSDLFNLSPPDVVLLEPADGENVLGGVPFTISWDASDPDGLERIDVLLSTDGGLTFDPLPGCELLGGGARECVWSAPGPGTATARLKVVARDQTGDEGIDQSMANFSIVINSELVVQSVGNPPEVLGPGSTFTASDTVLNDGNTGANASTTSYYLSADAIKSAEDRLSGSRAVPALEVGAQSSGTATVTVSSTTPPGFYTLLACADAGGVVTESNELNNCTASTTQLRVALPNLHVGSISGVPATVAPGASVSVTAPIHNSAEVAAGASTLRFYLSADGAKGPGDLLLPGKHSILTLGPGAISAGATTVKIPNSIALGSFYVLACADDLLKVSETDENNCLSTTTPMLVALPDLVILVVNNPPSTVAVGKSFVASDSVHNPSPVAALKSTTRYFLSLDTVKGLEDVPLTGTRKVPQLAAGATSTGSRSVSVPSATPPGTYHLLACADDNANLSETDEANNCRDASTTVLVTAPGG